MTSRAARRARERELAAGKPLPQRPRSRPARTSEKPSGLRIAAFGLVASVILGAGVWYAGSIFLARHDSAGAGEISMQISMSGFDPGHLNARPGQTLTLDWWNTDAAMHLTNGVHTLVSDSLGVRLELPAESRKTVTLTAPVTPGDYDFWCDSCCGGRDNPQMHGTLHVEP